MIEQQLSFTINMESLCLKCISVIKTFNFFLPKLDPVILPSSCRPQSSTVKGSVFFYSSNRIFCVVCLSNLQLTAQIVL